MYAKGCANQSPTLWRGLMQGLQRRPQVLLLPANRLQIRGLLQGVGPRQAHQGHSCLRGFLRELAAAMQLRAGRAEDGCLDQPAGPLLGVQACPGNPQAPRFTWERRAQRSQAGCHQGGFMAGSRKAAHTLLETEAVTEAKSSVVLSMGATALGGADPDL